jgi:tRNA threonylcarbamoyl adenosine modification protein YeaZ
MHNSNNITLLAIETSGATCGVCLMRENGFWGEYSVFSPHNHDRILGELTTRILFDAGISAGELSAVAVSAGPGSFTGLRIGAAFAKALCFNADDTIPPPKLIAVPTLDAFAAAAGEFAVAAGASEIAAAIPSHANLVYLRRFSPDRTPVSEIELTTTEELGTGIADKSVVCGPGAKFAPQALQLSGLNRPTPRFIARLGMMLYIRGEYVPGFYPENSGTFPEKAR